MAEQGYYRMYRGWQDHPVFGNEVFSKRDAFEWLIAHASFGPRTVGLPGKTITLSRGQLCYSLRYMANAWGWTEPRVRRWLARLADEKMIETCTKTDAGNDAGQTVITVSNYDIYQADADETDAENDAGATQHRRRSDANRKNVRREEGKEKKSPSGQKKATQLPEEWKPKPRHAEKAEALGLSLTREAMRFRTHATAKGRTLVNWDAGFDMWLDKSPEYGATNGARASPSRNGNGHISDDEWIAKTQAELR